MGNCIRNAVRKIISFYLDAVRLWIELLEECDKNRYLKTNIQWGIFGF